MPYEASVQDRGGDTADEGLDIDAPTSRTSEDENTPETASARKALFPSSIGLSFLISDKTTSLDLEVYWGDYQPIKPDGTVENKTKTDRWQRQRQLQRLTVQISDSTKPITLDVPHSDGLKLAISNRPVNGTTKLPAGIALRINVRTLFKSIIDTITKFFKFTPTLLHPILEYRPPSLYFVEVW